MKKIAILIAAVVIAALTTSMTYAMPKGKQPMKQIKSHSSAGSLSKGIQSIAPKATTGAAIDIQVTALADSVKKAYTTYVTTGRQVVVKEATTAKLIRQIKKNKQTLSTAQYTSINTIIASIKTETAKMTKLEKANLLTVVLSKKTTKLAAVKAADLTLLLNSINTNISHLNVISGYYGQINAILTPLATTTTSAITLQPAINN